MSRLAHGTGGDGSFCGLVGDHPRMLALRDEIRRAAGLDAPVVVCGPTGAGKELVARALHRLSACAEGPFCPVNVAALPESLLESEMFGSIKGAFTGALSDRQGLLEAAHGGSLLLDEAGDLPRPVQVKLLRALESGEIRRVGATQTTVARFRLIVATQAEPASLLRGGQWRDDFYYRVSAVVVRVPPLAARRSDIPLLASAYQRAQGLPSLEPDAVALLQDYKWPGNVRELQHVLVQAAHHAANGSLSAAAVRAALAERMDGGPDPGPVEAPSLARAKWQHVRETVNACGGDTRRAAELLGISRSQTYRILRHWNAAGAQTIRADANAMCADASAIGMDANPSVAPRQVSQR